MVEYHKKLTLNKLAGKVSCELSARTYGTEEWWVLVEREKGGAEPRPAASGRGRASFSRAEGMGLLVGRTDCSQALSSRIVLRRARLVPPVARKHPHATARPLPHRCTDEAIPTPGGGDPLALIG